VNNDFYHPGALHDGQKIFTKKIMPIFSLSRGKMRPSNPGGCLDAHNRLHYQWNQKKSFDTSIFVYYVL
jgi:hypothetical protein